MGICKNGHDAVLHSIKIEKVHVLSCLGTNQGKTSQDKSRYWHDKTREDKTDNILFEYVVRSYVDLQGLYLH